MREIADPSFHLYGSCPYGTGCPTDNEVRGGRDVFSSSLAIAERSLEDLAE